MEKNYDELIAKLQAKANDPKRNTELGKGHVYCDTGEPAYQTLPTATWEQILEVEAKIGLQFPDLMRQLYLRVGSGQWGPGYGLTPLFKTRKSFESLTLPELVKMDHEYDDEGWAWPPTLLPLCGQGCGRSFYVDCSRVDLPVIFVDPEFFPDTADFGEIVAELREPITEISEFQGFNLASNSLESFLQEWAEEA